MSDHPTEQVDREPPRREILVHINQRPHCVELSLSGNAWFGHTTFDVGVLGESVSIDVAIPCAALDAATPLLKKGYDPARDCLVIEVPAGSAGADHPTEQVDRVAQSLLDEFHRPAPELEGCIDDQIRLEELHEIAQKRWRRMARAALDAATPPRCDLCHQLWPCTVHRGRKPRSESVGSVGERDQ